MIARTLAAAVLALAISMPARAAEPTIYGALFDEVWKTVDENFYDPTFGGRDWRAIGDRYRARLPTVMDDAAFATLANAMLGELQVSHLYLSPPAGNAVKGGVGIGAVVEERDAEQVVVEVVPLSDAQRQGLRVGDRVLNPAELSGPLGASSDLQIRGCDGRRRTLRVRHERALWPPQHPAFEWRQVTIRPGVSLGYIRIDRFDDGAAALADQAMAELKDTQGLVIDVRRNTGGNLSGLRLTSYFSGASRPAVALLGKPYLQALGRRVTAADIAALPATRGAYTDEAIFAALQAGKGAAVYYSDDLGAARYAGKVVVVIGEETSSAGEGFAAITRDLAGATLVGRPTAGYLLSSDRFTLSGGWRLTAPVDGVWAADGRDYGDKAVAPDALVARTAADVCRADDPDLAKAVDILTAGLKP
ncbi:MAG: S41 family peptidase [Phenylobacterium sp.]